MLFTCIKLWFFRNHLANFHQISHWSYCWNVIDSLFKWLCSIDCQAHIFFFKTKNCSNDDLFIGCYDRIGKMLHNICISAVVMSLRWASRGLLFFFWKNTGPFTVRTTFFQPLPERGCLNWSLKAFSNACLHTLHTLEKCTTHHCTKLIWDRDKDQG